MAKNFLRIDNKFTFITSSSSSNRFPHVTVALFGEVASLIPWNWIIIVSSNSKQELYRSNFEGFPGVDHDYIEETYNSLDQEFRNHVAILLAEAMN